MVDCGLNEPKNRFVCPNDRQLALRAKLKTGWSVKTASFGGYQGPSTPLDQEEQETILEVIKRAELVEQTEQERVGRLVERLENLRRNALGRHSNQCLLCGDSFGMLGAQKVVCVDCRKFVCQKCAIDGCSPKQQGSKEQWLCMICAETREIWKKSGAWFFKTLPKYVLPGQQGCTYRDRSARSSKYDLDYNDPHLSAYHRQASTSDTQLQLSKELQPLANYIGNSHYHYERSQSGGSHSGSFSGNYPGSSFPGSSFPGNYPGNTYPGSNYPGSVSPRGSHPGGNHPGGNHPGSVSPRTSHPGSVSPRSSHPGNVYLGNSLLGNSLPGNSYPGNSYPGNSLTGNSGTSPFGESKSWDESTSADSKGDSNAGDSLDVSRRESATSKSTEWNWTDSRAEEKVSPGACSINSGIFKNPVVEHKPLDLSLGTMELSLMYDSITSTLHCTVYRAKNLIPMDINGLADPFCKLNILPSSKMSTRLRTKTVHKTRNPEFNENLTFYDISESDLMKKSLHILVVDDDKYGHDYMGETRIGLAKLRVQNTMYLTVPLEKLRPEQKGPLPPPDMNQWFDDLWSRGQLLLALQYNTKRRALLVTILRCVNLLPMDNNGFSDPFVKLHLRPDPFHRKHKTTIKWKNLNPIFNEEFAFETRPTELATQSLYLTVWDKDYGKSNDYLGGLILGGMGSKGQRLKQWLDMIKYPNHNHVCWHNLTEDTIGD